jgi:hypothetical protein
VTTGSFVLEVEGQSVPVSSIEGGAAVGVLGVGGAGAAEAQFALALDHERFFQAYLIAYTFWMGIVLGCLALLMVQHLSGGVWGIVLRRPFEAAVRTIPYMALLFIPILFGMHSLYEWSHADAVANDPILQQKALYLNVPFFYARQAFYFLVWGTIGHFLTSWSAEHDRTGDPALVARLSKLSGGGLLAYAMTMTFAMVDWTMSVNPHWFSTIWGMLYAGGQGLSAFAFGIIVLLMLAQSAPLNRVLTSDHFHDLGKLLFAFLMLWAYLSFSQFLIIWSANLTEEIPHYLTRWDGGWQWVSIFVIVLQFMLPYALLLSRDMKRDARRLRVLATWILATRIVEYYWQVAPEFNSSSMSLSLLDFGLPIAIGGIFLAIFAVNLRGRSLLPVNDPGLAKALAHHVH